MKCEHKGCINTEVVRCIVPASDGLINDSVEYLCTKHASEQGYCWGCGKFYGSCEDEMLDTSGLCEYCEADTGLYEEEQKFQDDDIDEYDG